MSMQERKLTCINLTQKNKGCKSAPAIINVRFDGLITLHCKRHWGQFYGRFAAMPDGLVGIRYNLARYNIINNTQGGNARFGMAMLFGNADADRMLANLPQRKY